MSIRTINGWHVDENNNRWDAEIATREQAEIFSRYLVNCHDCTNCVSCRDCSYCNDCAYCVSCHHCLSCRSCHDYWENPQRIVGWIMGSRDDIPAVYWLKPGKEQCIVGCFRGTLDELEAKVKETHADNPEHLKNYLKFIKNVRAYQKTCREGVEK